MNDRGSVSLAVLILTPLILASLALLAASYLLIKNDGDLRHLCRVQLLDSQERVRVILKNLMSLNKEARLLRRKRQIAERAVAMAPSPGEKTLALAALELVVIEQATLAARQQTLILRGRHESNIAPRATRHAIERTLRRARWVQSDSREALGFRSDLSVGSFDVVADPPGSPTPDYNPSPRFSEHQRMRVVWSFQISGLLPKWIQMLLKEPRLKFQANCSASLEGKGDKWQPKLTVDKS